MKTAVIICLLSFSGAVLPAFTQDDIHPKGWFKTGSNPAGFRIGFDNQSPHHGNQSVFIESIGSSKGFCTLMQLFSNESYRNQRLKMTGYVKSGGSADTAFMWVRIDDVEKKITADFDNMHDRLIVGTKDWTKYEIVFDVPESKCVINYGFAVLGSGKAWIDNISIETVDRSVLKTAKPLNAENPGYPDTVICPDKPINLDFEEGEQNF